MPRKKLSVQGHIDAADPEERITAATAMLRDLADKIEGGEVELIEAVLTNEPAQRLQVRRGKQLAIRYRLIGSKGVDTGNRSA